MSALLAQELVHLACRLPVDRLQCIAVHIGRRPNVGVPHPKTYILQGNALCNQHCSREMPQGVKPHVWKPILFEKFPEPVGWRIWVHGFAIPLGENSSLIDPFLPQLPCYHGLLFLVRLQQGHCAV